MSWPQITNIDRNSVDTVYAKEQYHITQSIERFDESVYCKYSKIPKNGTKYCSENSTVPLEHPTHGISYYDDKHEFLYIVQIDNGKNVESINIQNHSIGFGEYITVQIPWIPNDVGEYTANIFVMKSFDEPVNLLGPFTMSIDVKSKPDLQTNYSKSLNEQTTCSKTHVLVHRTSAEEYACVFHASMEKMNSRGMIEQVESQRTSDDITIRTGVWAGLCWGYCSQDWSITSDKITYSAPGYYHDLHVNAVFPDIFKEIIMLETEWQELLHLVDLDVFNSLPDAIGNPGETDGAVHWIEIFTNDTTKRISFESGDRIPEIHDLRLKLENIQKKIRATTSSFDGCVGAGNPIIQTYPNRCVTEDGLTFVKTSVDTVEECIALGFKTIDADLRILCVTESNQYVSTVKVGLQKQCEFVHGIWLQEYNECEAGGFPLESCQDGSCSTKFEDFCHEFGGNYEYCHSGCRNHPDYPNVFCAANCVRVCQFQ